MKVDIEANLLDKSVILNTFGKIVKYEIKKTNFFCHPVSTLRVNNLAYHLEQGLLLNVDSMLMRTICYVIEHRPCYFYVPSS